MARYKKDIAEGYSCADCVGLIKGHYWEQDGKVVYDPATDVSAGGMFDRSKIKGMIKDLPEVPGLILYGPGHVGVYEGGGFAIEARGFAYGVVRTKVSERSWTNWCTCPYISYAGYEHLLMPQPITEPYTALVVTRSSPLNIWADTRKTRSLMRVAKGDTLTVIGYADVMGWVTVQKDHVVGVADNQYLQRIDAPEPETDGEDADLPETHEPKDVLYMATVVGVKTGLNLRETPSLNGNTILLIPKDAAVEVLEDDVAGGFALVYYSGAYGFCTQLYLQRMDEVAPQFYDVRLRAVTEDVVAEVMRICPSAEVTEAE